ncbi:Transposase IS4 [Fragilaria crotonensis]|nr:Transposase IS4 [Fragilaria crotonensis]
MSSNDPRYQVGALVHAKAMHVTALIECHRRYGSNAKTKLVNGTVTELRTVPSSNQKRTVTLITAIYSLGGQCRKVATLNSRSVNKAGHVAAIPDERNEPVTGLGTDVSIPINIANETSTANEANDVDGTPSNIDMHTESETIVSDGLPVAPEGGPQDVTQHVLDTDDNAPSRTAATAHGIEWVRASVNASPLNGNFPRRIWSIRNSVGASKGAKTKYHS